ncbi:hypothetical protein BX616_000651 [Lobosporangium transversale]|uniref:Uncharacterized protein n=1 Tax=Lobosporangium transversale TaxID=64571 RepID=A0A1Y2G7V6_9FUNG|nr:hypothetical protein BCR41DRAFT_375167 [Lobosporangium transversale]KAF9917545.1 hypothetical protein BX616_000651 [Lobosporangium transversale]ORZ01928.1 hypothetical protein BCR41DRAFT_375167 [Lobosporangium transversale]|eukprot:XP_021876181.1 hypothetical protein BCR41DRAFT_375167 [Lobosporangium transversale]
MKAFLKLSVLLVAVLSIDAAPTNDAKTAMASMDSKIAEFYFRGCAPETTKITPLGNGVTEYTCTKSKAALKARAFSSRHTFGTNLFVSTSSGGINVNIGGNGAGVSGTIYGFRYSGYVDSAWETSRAVVYPMKSSIDEVVNLPKACSRDGHFCFDTYEGVCAFYFSNRVWERSCPVLKVIEFSVDP